MTGIRFRIDAAIRHQGALATRIARGQADITSGKRILAASDDPAAAVRIAQLRRTQTNEATWRGNVDIGIALAARADDTLGNVATLLDRARELATTGANETLSDKDRATIALELRSIADEVDSLSNGTDAAGQPIFPATPLHLPVGDSLSLTATTSRSDAFTVGARDIATILRDAATGITTSTAGRAAALSDVTTASEHIATVRGEQGARGARFDALRDRLIDSASAIAEERSSIEDTDLAATIARVQTDQLALDAAQSLFARINRRTLFDLLG
jgi:flagellar hook-associated protein 3 FlgL